MWWETVASTTHSAGVRHHPGTLPIAQKGKNVFISRKHGTLQSRSCLLSCLLICSLQKNQVVVIVVVAMCSWTIRQPSPFRKSIKVV